jgi:hypothetical protein
MYRRRNKGEGMTFPVAAASLLFAQNAYEHSLLNEFGRHREFHLPDLPENERIRVYTPKKRKHATKRRGNKLHDRRKK